jgi:hypothetical protein
MLIVTNYVLQICFYIQTIKHCFCGSFYVLEIALFHRILYVSEFMVIESSCILNITRVKQKECRKTGC